MEKSKEKIDLLFFEKQLLERGYKYICGVDEVGRGPLAGPVTCSAVIMNLEEIIEGVNDSKKLTEKKREKLFPLILENAVATSTVSFDNAKIDEMNILEATKACMIEAVMSLDVVPDIVLVDAINLNLPYETKGIVHGDAMSYSIGAASIVAKVTRDHFMIELGEKFPQYNFAKNKGYGTAEHIRAIKEFGATTFHRKSFIKNFV